VTAEWRSLLGDDFDEAEPLLRVLDLSPTYPCPSPAGRGCPRKVVERRGQLLAVCNDTPRSCESIPLNREDIVLREVRMEELAAIVARTLDLEPNVSTSRPGGEIWSLGSLGLRPGAALPSFFYSGRHSGRFDRGIGRLLRENAGPFVLVAARSLLSSPGQTAGLRRRKCILLEAEDVWYAADQNGRLVFADGEFRPAEQTLRGAETSGPRACELIRVGKRWRVRFDGKEAVASGSRGLELIAALVRMPGREIHAEQLLAAVDGIEEPAPSGSAGEVLDARALAVYKKRLEEIRSEIEEAQERGNDLDVETLIDERDQIRREVAAATGLGGRKRKASDDAEKSRKRASAAIVREIARLEAPLPDLAQHLRESIRLGAFISYAPTYEITWMIS
jgi:hypothetical protein